MLGLSVSLVEYKGKALPIPQERGCFSYVQAEFGVADIGVEDVKSPTPRRHSPRKQKESELGQDGPGTRTTRFLRTYGFGVLRVYGLQSLGQGLGSLGFRVSRA